MLESTSLASAPSTIDRAPAAGHLPYLDGWRGLAILLVLIGHFAPFAPGLLAGAGVEFFFVLSGRLMAEILIVRRMPLPTFFFRRASRILPALAFFVSAMFVAVWVTGLFGSVRSGLIGAVAALGFFQNYLPAGQASSLFEHTWSLAVEEHSYLLLALIAGFCVRERRAAIAIALLFALAGFLNGIRLSVDDNGMAPYTYWRTDVRAAAVFLSFALYLWAQDHFKAPRSDLWRWVSPACAIVGLALLLQPGLPPFVRFGVGTAMLAVAVSSVDVAHKAMHGVLTNRELMQLGILSYSLYLWQQPFLMLTRGDVSQVACVILAIGCALMSFHWIEQPSRTSLNRLWSIRGRTAARLPV